MQLRRSLYNESFEFDESAVTLLAADVLRIHHHSVVRVGRALQESKSEPDLPFVGAAAVHQRVPALHALHHFVRVLLAIQNLASVKPETRQDGVVRRDFVATYALFRRRGAGLHCFVLRLGRPFNWLGDRIGDGLCSLLCLPEVGDDESDFFLLDGLPASWTVQLYSLCTVIFP